MPQILYTPSYKVNLSTYFDKNNQNKILNSDIQTQNDNKNTLKQELFEAFDLDSYINNCLSYNVSNLEQNFDKVIIVPTFKQSEYIDRKLADLYFNKYSLPMPDFGVNNFQNFVNNLYETLIPKNKYHKINDNFQLSLIEQALIDFTNPEHKLYNTLNYYNADFLIKNSDNLNKLKMSINGLRNQGFKSDDLHDDINKYEQNKGNLTTNIDLNIDLNNNNDFNIYSIHNINKLKDFCKILQNYELKLSGSLIDYQNQINLLCIELEKNKELIATLQEKISHNEKITFNNLNDRKIFNLIKKSFLFYGFTQFESPEIKLIHQLKDCGFKICIHFDFTEFNNKLYENVKNIIDEINNYKSNIQFISRQFEKIEDINQQIEKYEIKSISPSYFVKNYLFNNIKNNIISKDIASNTQIYGVKNKYAEVDYITKLCQYLLDKKNNFGIEPEDIVICSRNPKNYADIFREVGLKNNVQFNISDRFNLKNSKVVSDVINFIQILENDFKLNSLENDFDKLLNLQFFNFTKSIESSYNLQNFKTNKSIIYSNPNENIISKLLILKSKHLNEISDNNLKVLGNSKYLEIKFDNFKEGKSYDDNKSIITKIDNAILEIVNIYNEVNIFDNLNLDENSTNSNEIFSLDNSNKNNTNKNVLEFEITDIEFFNRLPEKNRLEIFNNATTTKKLIIPNFKHYFKNIYTISQFETIIYKILSKFKILKKIINLRKLIIDETTSNNLNLDINFLDNIDINDLFNVNNNLEDYVNDYFNNYIDIIDITQNDNNYEFTNNKNQQLDNKNLEELDSNKYLISKFNDIKKNIKQNIYENLENDVKAYNNFLSVLNELKNVSNKIDIENNNNITKYSLSEWFIKFKTLLNNTKYQILERKNKSINVTSIEQTRGIDYKVSILCGLTKDEFPLKFQVDTLVGKDLENSNDKFNNNEKMLLYFFFNNGINNLNNINSSDKPNNVNKLFYIFYPIAKDNKLLKDSQFLKEILFFLDNSENSNQNNAINDIENGNFISDSKLTDYEKLKNKYIFKINNFLKKETINELNISNDNKNPLINIWLESLIDKNIYLNKNEFSKLSINNTQQFNSKYYDELLKNLKNQKINKTIFNISSLSHIIDSFYPIEKSDNNYNKPKFSSKEKIIIENFIKLKIEDKIQFEIEDKVKGTFFHNSVEKLINNLRYNLINTYPEILVKDKIEEKIIINKDNIKNYIINLVEDNETNSNIIGNKNLSLVVNKLSLIEDIMIDIKNQLLQTYPDSIYIEYECLQYRIVVSKFIDFIINLSKQGKFVLFSELNLINEQSNYNSNKNVTGYSLKIDSLNLDIKFKGNVDLIIADFGKNTFQNEKPKTNTKTNSKTPKSEDISENLEINLDDKLNFSIYDLKYKKIKDKKIESIQLYLYFEAFKSFLVNNEIDSEINDLALIFLKENINSMYGGTIQPKETYPDTYIKNSQNRLESALNELINNNNYNSSIE